ncbi:MAG TPA: Gfo/Idh/MocA family oxidoreductase [Tepidiformaceae bacterium]|nr:Gfo/Idh/MocA family oxidoreductase [Tepidiformaceae bacterium]
MPSPIRIGLIGAGPWAHLAHARAIAAHPQTVLTAVWARRPEAASELANKYGATACASVEQLLDASEAVVFSVPPDVQERLAPQAAAAGKPLLLEKPIAGSLSAAEQLAEAASTVPTLVALRWRYSQAVREFIRNAHEQRPFAGRASFISGSLLAGNPFATPWRLERGALLDLGPHVVDLLDAALGPVTAVRAHGSLQTWVGLLLEHESGAHSEASLCASIPLNPSQAGAELFGPAGALRIDCEAAVGADAFGAMYDEFVATARGERTATCDVARGLAIQRVLEDAENQLLR